ncbi:hypothetical protein CERZMDRAFT_103727 [Cercospora zeae-maydis SCOH1-5]|uniref:Zn(2)-C6 fungal-type domain-containing protein n=1 Tax=Cercospora zeae-maydis SCOH1-5 TaxID=717836 RepID=A0A6A6EV56_9PEZI|nr:hypothetical protein CERZMDRAFT_103727 [Cercospora zeae-maydis SCOH1-5]
MGDRPAAAAAPAASDVLLRAFDSAKRQAVVAACQRCRQRKTKCDGERPCASCAAAGSECAWVTQQNETRRQAVKRKHEEMVQASEPVLRFHHLLTTADHDQAFEMLRRLRAGQSVDSILGARHDVRQAPAVLYEQRVYGQLPLALAQSTAPLSDIVRIAQHIVHPHGASRLPAAAAAAADALRCLRRRIIRLEDITGTLSDNGNDNGNGNVLTDAPHRPGQPVAAVTASRDAVPIYRVPAAPWVGGDSTDGGVSDLVTTFLCVTNPFQQFVDADLFVADMRSQDEHSHYCSPLLVNAVLACASLFSEHDEAFAHDHDYLTRGEHYHHDALRLWELEHGRASIANAQALAILSGESSWRGQDRLGWSLHQALARMLKTLNGAEPPSELDDQAARTYKRVRACTASSAVRNHMYWVMGLFGKSGNELVDPTDAPDLRGILKDEAILWRPYPARRPGMPLHLNLLAIENQSICRFLWEILDDVCADNSDLTQKAFWENLGELEARFCYWFQYLPAPLAYTAQMPMALFEFHAQYLVAQMLLNDHWAEVLLSEASIYFDRSERDAVRQRTLRYAIDSAIILRDFRSYFGSKQNPPFLFQLSAMSASILLRYLESNRQHPAKNGLGTTSRTTTITPDQIIPPFEECCRCLLAFSLHLMLPRGINRMLHRTAMEKNVRLPESVQMMLEVFGKDAWSAMDAKRISSAYPNILRGPASLPGEPEEILEVVVGLEGLRV